VSCFKESHTCWPKISLKQRRTRTHISPMLVCCLYWEKPPSPISAGTMLCGKATHKSWFFYSVHLHYTPGLSDLFFNSSQNKFCFSLLYTFKLGHLRPHWPLHIHGSLNPTRLLLFEVVKIAVEASKNAIDYSKLPLHQAEPCHRGLEYLRTSNMYAMVRDRWLHAFTTCLITY